MKISTFGCCARVLGVVRERRGTLGRERAALRLEFVRKRWYGATGHPSDLPGQGDGRYEWNVTRPDGFDDHFYHAGPKDLAFMESEDRKYLREIARSNPELFLQEMTPVPGHDKTQKGLDLTEPLHRTYQEEFMGEVARVCRERGL